MAQGATTPGLANGIKTLTAEELHEILECGKIVLFRDAVLAGKHPRIHVPTPLVAGSQPESSPIQLSGLNSTIPGETNSTAAIPTEINNGPRNKASNTQLSPISKPAGLLSVASKTGVTEINPILLEKSDELRKAEIQLQRQRLERVLREQVEERRISLKASLQTSESLPDFDISEVLSKALAIVQHSAENEVEVEEEEEENFVGTHTSSASDSFDVNTFYSSQHDTPGLSSPSQRGEDVGTETQQMASGQSFETVSTRHPDDSHDVVMTGVSLINQSHPAVVVSPSLSQHLPSISRPSQIPGLNSSILEEAQQIQSDSGYEKDGANSSASSQQVSAVNSIATPDVVKGNSSKGPQDLTKLSNLQAGEPLKRKIEKITSESPEFDNQIEPALIESRSQLSPFAPQPARISPLATARVPPILDQNMIIGEAPPAQVAALRKETVLSSPDGSPRGTKEKKKKKKKGGRKSAGKDSTAVDTPITPYIKPEPISPSPYHAAPLPRPKKRQRQIVNHGAELNYDEPRYDPSIEVPTEETAPTRYRQHEAQYVSNGSEDVRMHEPQGAQLPRYRQVRDENQYRRVVSYDSYATPRSPDMYSIVPTGQVPVSMQAPLTEDRAQRPRLRRKFNIPPGAVQIDLEGEKSRSPALRERRSPIQMAPPPRMAPARIVIDEYGRQYYAPVPAPTSSRLAVGPSPRAVGDEIIYERVPPRALHRQVADIYEDDGIMYRRASPGFVAPTRRVVTQPELDPQYRSYREYSSRSMAIAPPSEEYVRVQPNVRQVSHSEEEPRQHASRVGSVRPEALRYDVSRADEIPREYAARVGSVRPEPLRPEASRYDLTRINEVPREYVDVTRPGSVRPEALRPEASHQDVSQVEEVPREYFAKTRSVRPEAVKYEMPLEYSSRLGPVRPEPLMREYPGSTRIRELSMRPEPRREIPMEQLQGGREFSVRPAAREPVRREYIVQDDVYASSRPIGRRILDNVEYLEPPRQREGYEDRSRRDADIVYR